MNQPSSDVHYKKFLRKKMSAIQMNSPSPVNSCSRSLNVAATTMFPLFKISYKCRELSNFLAKDLLKVSSTFTKYMNPPPGGGVLNKCLYGEAPPRGPTPYPFIYHFSQKRYPFRIHSIEKMVPHLHTLLRLLYPFSDNSHLLTLLGPFTDQNDRFPYPFIYFS